MEEGESFFFFLTESLLYWMDFPPCGGEAFSHLCREVLLYFAISTQARCVHKWAVSGWLWLAGLLAAIAKKKQRTRPCKYQNETGGQTDRHAVAERAARAAPTRCNCVCTAAGAAAIRISKRGDSTEKESSILTTTLDASLLGKICLPMLCFEGSIFWDDIFGWQYSYGRPASIFALQKQAREKCNVIPTSWERAVHTMTGNTLVPAEAAEALRINRDRQTDRQILSRTDRQTNPPTCRQSISSRKKGDWAREREREKFAKIELSRDCRIVTTTTSSSSCGSSSNSFAVATNTGCCNEKKERKKSKYVLSTCQSRVRVFLGRFSFQLLLTCGRQYYYRTLFSRMVAQTSHSSFPLFGKFNPCRKRKHIPFL